MKFNFNKKMVSTIVILIFGVAIKDAALSQQLQKKRAKV